MRLLIEAAYLWQCGIHGLSSSHLEPITAIVQEQSSLFKPCPNSNTFTIIVAATRIEPVQLGHRMSMSLEVAVDRECHSGPKNLTASNCPHLLRQLLSSPNIHLGAEHGNAQVSVRAAANPHPTGAFLSS